MGGQLLGYDASSEQGQLLFESQQFIEFLMGFLPFVVKWMAIFRAPMRYCQMILLTYGGSTGTVADSIVCVAAALLTNVREMAEF